MPGKLLERTWQSNPVLYAPAKYKRACKYLSFLPDQLTGMPLSIEGTVAGVLSEAEQSIRALNDTAGSRLAPLARLLLRTESIASSKVEGMQLGVRELARAEARVESGQGASPTATDVLANIGAMVLALDEAANAPHFGQPEIKAIHRRLLEHAGNQHVAGVIRAEQNWLGGNDFNPCGADFVPPPAEELERLLADLSDAINDDVLPPLVQAALVHAQFETIHPFHDGNGRTGRALIHVVLRRRGIAPRYTPPISVVLATDKGRYLDGLAAFRTDDIGKWIEYFAAATASAAHLASVYLAAVEALTREWREKLAALPNAPRAGATAWVVIDALPAHPIISASIAATATERNKPSIYDALRQLENAGVLIPLSAAQRHQSWEAAGLLDLIARVESGDVASLVAS